MTANKIEELMQYTKKIHKHVEKKINETNLKFEEYVTKLDFLKHEK
eukprot:CAMPEP_0116942044 /NCGR_PEP_ID=MMETSP0467-20121206/34354_1 /TAXON_ID=283647 /ORGANISM="Mesodinium pulex, Strain SPMC105" /LENGTH=45 /DNA_ID= /DNA_START= /DNA_END= /DNA_ORIENTATION=